MRFKLMQFIFLLGILFGLLVQSQPVSAAGGLNNALMNVPSAFTLNTGQLEFSPTWQTSFINQKFDANGERKPLSPMAYFSTLEIRVTLGLPEQWEVGFAVQGNWRFDTAHTVSMEKVSLGIRRDLVRIGEIWALNLFVGIKLPTSADDQTVIPDIGLVQSYKPLPWLQLDASFGLQLDSSGPIKPGFRYDLGVGAFVVKEKLQIVLEWSHEWVWGQEVAAKGVLGAGINWNVTSAGTLTFGVLFDLAGHNHDQGYVAYLAYAHIWNI